MYVFDTSSLSNLTKFYYPKRFPTLWNSFNALIANKKVFSVLEVYREFETRGEEIKNWLKANKSIFYPPSDKEALFMTRELFAVKNGHFQHIVEKSKQLKGGFCADPFLVASAKINQAMLITEETKRPNSSKIPNICEHFEIPCFNLEGFMERENWKF